MQPRIRMGLIVGAIGLALNVCVAGFIGLCGPAVSLLGGVIAGFLAAQQEKAALKADGAPGRGSRGHRGRVDISRSNTRRSWSACDHAVFRH